MLLVDGNPLDDITILQDKKRFLMIMKDGDIYRPTGRPISDDSPGDVNWLAAS